nr:transcription antitermination factor NusB [uncultured Mediterraneibacter sp.]
MIRSQLREHVFKMLFQIEFNDAADMPERLRCYFDFLDDAKDRDKEYIQKKYEAVASHLEEIDRLIEDTSKGWKPARMNKVDLTILRLAVYEMRWDDDVPEGVAINEAVELAKKFGGDSSSSFVNGVLGKLARQES